MNRKFLIDFLKQLEAAIPPPDKCHHAITYAQYGDEECGWDDRLAVQVNHHGKFICFLLDDADCAKVPAQIVAEIKSYVDLDKPGAQIGAGFGQYLPTDFNERE